MTAQHRTNQVGTTTDAVVRKASAVASSDAELAVALHDYVRDHIAFGFTPWFDHASAATTMRIGVGHCNPQAKVMVEMFRHAGFEARYRPVTITNDVLRGVASTPRLLSHVFTEVDHGSGWCRLDSYIVDRPLRTAAVRCLHDEGRRLGYGCHVDATDWTGHGNAFSQIATEDLVVESHDTVEDLDDFYSSGAFRHQLGPVSYSSLLAPLRPGRTPLNSCDERTGDRPSQDRRHVTTWLSRRALLLAYVASACARPTRIDHSEPLILNQNDRTSDHATSATRVPRVNVADHPFGLCHSHPRPRRLA